jgi:Flp pilus assembly protein TadG
MNQHTLKLNQTRRGAILVLAAILMTALVGMISFAVDYGYLLKVRTDLQRSADASALAAVQDLIRKADGTQDLDKTRETARTYARDNLDDTSIQIASDDIQIGRYDPKSIYSNVTLLNNGTFDTVRVTLRRDGAVNPTVPLFFARVLGIEDAPVVAKSTAILQKAQLLTPGAEILPFATPKPLWDSLAPGDQWSAYGDGKIKDESGAEVPGNWGTLDIGSTDNSTTELNDQILNGLRQNDLNELYSEGRTAQGTHIDSAEPVWMQGDTGLSSGLKSSVQAVHGKKKLIPIYDKLGEKLVGNNTEYHIIGWGVVTVISSDWQGQTNTRVIVEKSHAFMGRLHPKGTLSATSGYVDGAYTSPVLVE